MSTSKQRRLDELKAQQLRTQQQRESAAPQKRTYSQNLEFDTDTFKLSPEECVRWDSVTKKNYHVEHTHIFHTKDSSGKVMGECGPTAGHFHVMTVKDNGPDMLPTVMCGPPMKFEKVKRGGTYKKTAVPYNSEDEHTHEVTHLGSSRLKPRSANVEAAKIQAIGIPAPVPGISEGVGLPPVDGKVDAT